MESKYNLVRTILLCGDGDTEKAFRYEIYRCDDGYGDNWYIIPAKKADIEVGEGSFCIWVNLSPKSFGGSNDIESVISECIVHYREFN
ncbi:hypothetical protein [Klebsiella michiganensis]|uniref:hypothetical protein n=1 Tax=Klebsiella michiganensis TaxID=1134687 RepID=UPI001E5809B3|nr:hypothetical protein [Klebsiella michiganensis]UHC89751.1 hypothetical protein LUW95_10855 [Klebsiella michiganensis]